MQDFYRDLDLEDQIPPSLLWGFQEFLSEFYPNHTVDNTEEHLIEIYCDYVASDRRYKGINLNRLSQVLKDLLNSHGSNGS